MLHVDDTEKNRTGCLCPECPSYPHNDSGERLYCAVTSSSCEITARGCICPECPVYEEYHLTQNYFCDRELVGDARVPMRKRKTEEDGDFYRGVYGIKAVATTGGSIIRAMGSRKKMPFSLDDLHFLPAQVWRIPGNKEEPVDTRIILGPLAKKPLYAPTPILISGLSFGAVSRNVRIIIAQAAATEKFIFNSGEGGVLEEELAASDRIIVQYATGRFGITEELLRKAAAVEIRFGQGAYPGKGSLLPAVKMTEEVAEIRGLKEGQDAYSPAHHADMMTPEQIHSKVEWLKHLTGGVPVGAKIGCGNIEKDLDVLVGASVDFVAIDGFGAGTGATSDYVRENVGIPLMAALPRAVRYLKQEGVREQITLIADGNLRTSADYAKCIALGADAVYIGTAALIAINCEQYRICHTGLCPTGVTTQDSVLGRQCPVDEGVRKLSNYVRVMTEEIAALTRIVGKTGVHDLSPEDLVALTREASQITGCAWVGGKCPLA
jgi:glutamate synthase domain-containing protein 2